jgi:hypothetical protein
LDAVAIFNELKTKCAVSEEFNEREKFFEALIKFINEKRNLSGEMLIFIDALPLNNIPPSMVPKVDAVVKGTEFEGRFQVMLSKWKDNTESSTLAKISESILSKK